MYPILLFAPPAPPPRCPHCHEIEKRVETCAHCDYHYPLDAKVPGIVLIWIWLSIAIGVVGYYLDFLDGGVDPSIGGAVVSALLAVVLFLLAGIALVGLFILGEETIKWIYCGKNNQEEV